MIRAHCTVLLIMMLLPVYVAARPVSYPGGITLMQQNDGDRSRIHLHYSPSARYSLGYKAEYSNEERWRFHGIQLNNLLKRWNQPAAQANIYLKSGLGTFRSSKGDYSTALFTGMAVDWENRRLFTSYENRLFDSGDAYSRFSQSVRFGIAPYLGNYGDLHTWLMLQLDHNPEADEPVLATPLVRIFKHEYLAEFGLRENGDALFNFIIRF